MKAKKLRVAVIFGGRSGEHEISLQSAASVIRNLDPNRFEVLPVAIDKKGRWLLCDPERIGLESKALRVQSDGVPVVLPPESSGGTRGMVPLNVGSLPSANALRSTGGVDVVFPVMHGTLCEDGTIQGLLELSDVPYVGPGVLASAVGMDKDVAKRLIRAAELPVVPWISVKSEEWKKNRAAFAQQVEKELGFPAFVKPANAGSSVGVHKVKAREQLDSALEDAFRYDVKVLVERAVSAREIELSVLEGKNPGDVPRVSVPGEVTPTHEFYSYEAKYLDENGAALEIPAKLTSAQVQLAQKIAAEVFDALGCEGMSRVDLFLDKQSGEFYFNEINTIPGFTSISMYPKLWEASGLGYSELLTELIDLAIARHKRRAALVRDFRSE